MVFVTGPTNAAIAAHLFGLVAALVGPDLISVHNGSITWS